MSRLYNLARMHAATLGTGSLIDLGNAVTGFLTFANAGVADGITISYAINDPLGGGSEVGSGVYHSSGPSFTRTTVEKSSSGTSRISLSASAEIMIAPSAADLNLVYDYAAYLSLTSTALSPATTDTVALGTSAAMWSDAFFASGAVLNFNNGDVAVTHSANALAFAGASSGYSFDAVVKPSANDAAAIGSATVSWADLFLASGGVINWANGDASISHVASNIILLTASNSIAVSTPNLRPASNDSSALGNSTDKWADLFLASGGVINWNSGDATLTHATKKLAVGVNAVETAYWETPGSSTYTPASGSVAGHYIANVGNALNPNGVTGQFETPGIGPYPSSGLLHIFAKYNDSSAGNISNIFAVAYNQGTRYTAGVTGIASAGTGATGTNLWGGQFSAVARGNAGGILQGANIEADYSTGAVTAIALTLKLGDSAGGTTANPGNAYIYSVCDQGKEPSYGWRIDANSRTAIHSAGSIIGVEGSNNSCTNGIDFSASAFSGSAFKSPGFSVGGTGIVTGLSSVFTADRAIRCNNQTSSAAAQVGTLTNAPAAGNPGFWLKINVGGTNYAVPCWAG